MSLISAAGTTIGFDTNAPSTIDAAGFEGLTYTEVGNVESVPQLGVQVNSNSFTPVDTGIIEYYCTTTDHPELTIPLAFSDDSALDDLRTARDDKTLVSWRVQYNDAPSNGTASARYFQAFVLGVMEEPGAADGIVMGSVMLRPQPSTYVEVAAAAGA